jgi:hypothetical protein
MRTLLLLALLCTVTMSAQERILGLVEILGIPGFEQLPADQPGILVRAEPSAASTVIAELRAYDAIEFREHGYEERSAIFYNADIIGDLRWYQVRLAPSGQAGWISGENVGPVHLVDELLKDSLTYFTDS